MSSAFVNSPSVDSAARDGAAPIAKTLMVVKRRLDSATREMNDALEHLSVLDLRHRKLVLNAGELGIRSVILVGSAIILVIMDSQFMAPFAQVVSELTTGAMGPALLAAVISTALVGTDITVGLIFPSGGIDRRRSLFRSVLVGMLLAVPATMVIATATARWSIQGVMPVEKQWVTLAATLLVVAVHFGLIALSGSGAPAWIRYKIQRFRRMLDKGRAERELIDAQKAYDEAAVDFQVGIGDDIREEMRSPLFNEEAQPEDVDPAFDPVES